jgi:hypothetical protein
MKCRHLNLEDKEKLPLLLKNANRKSENRLILPRKQNFCTRREQVIQTSQATGADDGKEISLGMRGLWNAVACNCGNPGSIISKIKN